MRRLACSALRALHHAPRSSLRTTRTWTSLRATSSSSTSTTAATTSWFSTTPAHASSSPLLSSSSSSVLSSPWSASSSASSVLLGGHGIVQHRPSDYNNEDTPFEFTEESKKQIEWWLKKYPASYKRSAVMPLLYIAQEQEGANNWLPLSAMNKIAEVLDMPPIRVYEVATFYTMFNREPVGKFHIQLCGTTPCQLCGSEAITAAIEKHLNIKSGETSADGMFTLTEVECLGACVNAPMIQINNREFYENLTPETTIKLLDDLKAGREVKVGPQNGQVDCEGPNGRTSLKDPSSIKPVCRDLAKVKAEMEKAAEEAAAAAAKEKAAKDKKA